MIRREALGDQTMVSSDRSTGRICMNSDIIKVIAIDRMVWFQGKQLALALGFKDPIKSLQTHVDDSDRQLLECHLVLVTATETRLQWVSECGFYSLVYGSTLPSAKAFKAWVIREVLPSIRRTGELLDTEHSLVKAYDRRPVLYIGNVGTHDGIALVKIGCSDTIREMVRKLKTGDLEQVTQHLVPGWKHQLPRRTPDQQAVPVGGCPKRSQQQHQGPGVHTILRDPCWPGTF